MQAELSELLAFSGQRSRAESRRRLHPRSLWRLYGERFVLWHPICLRLFSYPASAACGERAFKRLHQVRSTRRNYLSPGLLDQLSRIAFNDAQLRCPDPVTAFSRSATKVKLFCFFLPLDEPNEGGGGGIGDAEGGGLAVPEGAGGQGAAGGAILNAGAPALAVDGSGLDAWGDEEDVPPDNDPADVDAIVAQLLL